MDERRPPRLVEWLVAAIAGAALQLLAGLLVPPAAAPPPTSHGEHFAAMAAAPFAFDGLLPHRVLWPLLAHVAGWVGIGPVAFSQVCSGALLAVVSWFCRRRGAGWPGALLVAAAVAASGAVLVYQPLVCWSDSLVLLALVMLVHFAPRPVVFWAIVLLAALAHELIFCFAPWLLWLRVRTGGGSLARDGGALAVTLAAYAAWRALVHTIAPDDPNRPVYGFAYYLDQNFWVPWLLPLMWALWALVVVVEFGPLLAVAVAAWRRGELALGGRAGPWLYVVGMLSLMVLAYDVMRFAAFWLLPVVLGGIALVRRRHGSLVLAVLVAVACATYRWQHPVASEQGGRAFTDVSGHVRELLIARMQAAGAADVLHVAPRDAWTLTVDLLARTWPTFAAAALAWLAAIGLGLLLARTALHGVSPASDR